MKGKLEKELQDALTFLERELHTPVIAGELRLWTASTARACQRVRDCMSRRFFNDHDALMDEVLRQDPGQASRIQQARETDERLLTRIDASCQQARTLNANASSAEPEEVHLMDQIADFRETTEEIIRQTREQETSLNTWYHESLYRDRGVAD